MDVNEITRAYELLKAHGFTLTNNQSIDVGSQHGRHNKEELPSFEGLEISSRVPVSNEERHNIINRGERAPHSEHPARVYMGVAISSQIKKRSQHQS